ncbi:PREDICTED: uncharacterized protein LOC105510681 [Colobus angolensis palliatus]|uniref:uncharacterized protein LOC105510681 n=1 Tax=Colobus angolensis palliatus TaxID=336983 RepID=UPI0005F39320|nr:PREDICTED: uncharacterized protein LOC105510681 [Colobus angolensis palliatus]
MASAFLSSENLTKPPDMLALRLSDPQRSPAAARSDLAGSGSIPRQAHPEQLQQGHRLLPAAHPGLRVSGQRAQELLQHQRLQDLLLGVHLGPQPVPAQGAEQPQRLVGAWCVAQVEAAEAVPRGARRQALGLLLHRHHQLHGASWMAAPAPRGPGGKEVSVRSGAHSGGEERVPVSWNPTESSPGSAPPCWAPSAASVPQSCSSFRSLSYSTKALEQIAALPPTSSVSLDKRECSMAVFSLEQIKKIVTNNRRNTSTHIFSMGNK